jgi:hypothetical protein
MRATLATIALGAAIVAAPVALACDPEEINAMLSAQCAAALDPAAALVGPLRAHALPEEGRMIDAALARARQECADGDPAVGARLAVTLARLAGRIEARAGLATPITLAAESAR